jgi:hypothetical protein
MSSLFGRSKKACSVACNQAYECAVRVSMDGPTYAAAASSGGDLVALGGEPHIYVSYKKA